jgi:hypothetical protein
MVARTSRLCSHMAAHTTYWTFWGQKAISSQWTWVYLTKFFSFVLVFAKLHSYSKVSGEQTFVQLINYIMLDTLACVYTCINRSWYSLFQMIVVYACMCVSRNVSLCLNGCIWIVSILSPLLCFYACKDVGVQLFMPAAMYSCMYVCVYVCMYVPWCIFIFMANMQPDPTAYIHRHVSMYIHSRYVHIHAYYKYILTQCAWVYVCMHACSVGIYSGT